MDTKRSNDDFHSKSINDPQSEKLSLAASKIQRFWRKYIDLQVFKYYKDLVIFHNEGDPSLIMKYINPIEAQLIDSASGIHIKFRLAGQHFPPTIHYKIFTHRPVQDLCANAPRDYTKPYIKLKPALAQNLKSVDYPEQTEDGWYKRIENNGWRPVSNKHLVQMNMDYYYGIERNSKPVSFHHTKILRRQDIELKKKQTKIDWMRTMYKNGMLKPKGNDDETNQIIKKATKSFFKTFDNKGIESVQDWEVDELLEWTNALNFEDYQSNWKSIGTSAPSEKFIMEEKRLRSAVRYRKDRFYDDLPDPLEFSTKESIGSSTPVHTSTQRQNSKIIEPQQKNSSKYY